MIIAFASAAHGRDYPKWLGQWGVVTAALFVWAAVASMTTGWLGALVAGLFVPIYWLLFRVGKADIELQYMDKINYDIPLLDVMKAHYYIGFLTCLGLVLFNYSTKWGQRLGWEKKAVNDGGKWHGKPVRLIANNTRVHPDDFPFWDCRRPTEFLTGLTGDLLLTVIITLMVI